MKRLLIPRTAVAAIVIGALALALAACGGSSSQPSSTSAAAAPAAGGLTVQSKQVSGAGDVLVDENGLPLYTNDQESGHTMLCGTACVSFWRPLTVTGAPNGGSLGSKLGLITRNDGSKQVTWNGKALYTFSLDKPGQVNGDGAADAFDGQKFTWHVVHADGSTSSSGGQSSTSSGRGY
jgi:predicted lipoprotein with Yx(FWY)xxD motif